jgi:hypothetical protein
MRLFFVCFCTKSKHDLWFCYTLPHVQSSSSAFEKKAIAMRNVIW